MTTIPPLGPLAAVTAATDSLLLRALLAADAAQIAAAPATATQTPPPPAAPAAAVAPAVATATQAAASAQGGLAPLMADLAAALETPGLPQPVLAAATQVLALQTPLAPTPTAQSLRQGLAQSGLLLEAHIAAAPDAPIGPDLKAALLTLRQALQAAVGDAPVAVPLRAGQAPASAPPAASPPQSDTQAEPQPPPQPRSQAPPPAPPYRDGPLRAQPAAPAALASGMPAGVVEHRLLQDAGAALARQVLFQLASLPAATHADGSAQWRFELPLATPQGAAVAQFEIGRDDREGQAGPGATAADGEPAWRARFSLDLEATGPVHARISIAGGNARVSLWAERGDTAQALAAQRGALAQELAGQDLDAAVVVFPGQPPSAQPAVAGRFVDRAL